MGVLMAGGCRGRKGITGIRTAGSLMYLGNNNNDGLGEEFTRKKKIFRMVEIVVSENIKTGKNYHTLPNIGDHIRTKYPLITSPSFAFRERTGDGTYWKPTKLTRHIYTQRLT